MIFQRDYKQQKYRSLKKQYLPAKCYEGFFENEMFSDQSTPMRRQRQVLMKALSRHNSCADSVKQHNNDAEQLQFNVGFEIATFPDFRRNRAGELSALLTRNINYDTVVDSNFYISFI